MTAEETEVADRGADSSQRAYARLAGSMYLVVLGFDVAGAVMGTVISGKGSFGETSHRIVASETLYRVGLGCSLAGSLSTILLALGLYAALRPVDPNLAMVALLFRVAESAIGGLGTALGFATLQINLAASQAGAFDANQLGALANLNAHATGAVTSISAIFFSLGSTLFFYLFLRSSYIPRVLSAWGVFASLFYATAWFTSLILPSASAVVTYASLPILIAEVSAGLWLLVVGIKTRNLGAARGAASADTRSRW